jgi:HD-GYP domain-containing protein (c-di-GMP phosphodiesterase class II)
MRVVEDRLDRDEISQANALFQAIDLFDRPLAGHCLSVSLYARDLAVELGLSEDEQNLVFWAARVHELGKLELPRDLVWKPGELALEERREFEEHPLRAEKALQSAGCGRLAPIVRHQGERFDGLGYPDGLAGESIPLASRILAVADVYNDLTMTTPTRDALPEQEARRQIVAEAGVRFDPSVVTALEHLIRRLDREALP